MTLGSLWALFCQWRVRFHVAAAERWTARCLAARGVVDAPAALERLVQNAAREDRL
jgi:predicted MarR family transcription regulator